MSKNRSSEVNTNSNQSDENSDDEYKYSYVYEYDSYDEYTDSIENTAETRNSNDKEHDNLTSQDYSGSYNTANKSSLSAPNSIYSSSKKVELRNAKKSVNKSSEKKGNDSNESSYEEPDSNSNDIEANGNKNLENVEEKKEEVQSVAKSGNRFNLQRKMESASKFKKIAGNRIQDTLKVNKMKAQANVATSDAIFKDNNNKADFAARFVDSSSKIKNLKMSSISGEASVNVDWFSLRDILTAEPISSGMVNILPPDESYIPIRVSSLSVPHLQQYSIFESDNCRFVPSDLDYGFPSCAPSKKTIHIVPPILQKNMRTSRMAKTMSFTLWLLLQAIKIVMLICYFILKTPMLHAPNMAINEENLVNGNIHWYKFILGIGCVITFTEIIYCFCKSLRAVLLYIDAQKTVYSQLFEASAVLATALPRTLLSECGKGKFLREQLPVPKFALALLSIFSLVSFIILTIPFTLSLNETSPAIWKLLLLSRKTDTLSSSEKLIYALETAPFLLLVSMVISSLEFFCQRSIIKSTDKSREVLANSTACNLRGFIPGRGFGLDFSVVHGVEEGLCYIMGQAGTNMSDNKNVINPNTEFLNPETENIDFNNNASYRQTTTSTGNYKRVNVTNVNFSNTQQQENPIFSENNMSTANTNAIMTYRRAKGLSLCNKKYRNSIYRKDDSSLSSSAIFVPFLSVIDIELHLEPVDITLTYEFSPKQLVTIDSRSHVLANDILKRGYDSIIVRDILPWIILVLANGIRMWIPLSLSQLKPEIFGATGSEMAAILDVIAASLEVEGDDSEQKSAIEKIELNNSKIEANLKTSTVVKQKENIFEYDNDSVNDNDPKQPNNEPEENASNGQPSVHDDNNNNINIANATGNEQVMAVEDFERSINEENEHQNEEEVPNATTNNDMVMRNQVAEVVASDSENEEEREPADNNVIVSNNGDYFANNDAAEEGNSIPLSKKLRYLSQFCREYEKFKAVTPLEEVFHLKSIEKIFIPQTN